MRKKKLIAQAMGGNPTRFITLTIQHPPGGDPIAARKLIADAWPIFCRDLNEKYRTQHFEYLCVIEATTTGWPHLHILTPHRWIAQKWIKETWLRLTGSSIVWIRKVTSKKGAAAYIAKYIGKAPHKFGTFKRYWQSAKYDRRKRFDKGAAESIWGHLDLIKRGIVCIAIDLEEQGWVTHWKALREFTAERPP